MSHTLKPYWLTMSSSRLQTHLRKNRYPADIILKLVNEHQRIKESQRASRIKQTVIYKQWHFVVQPARDELGVVRTMKSAIKRESDMTEALTNKLNALQAYEEALVKVVTKLNAIQKEDAITPAELVAQLREAGKQDIPNNGAHWTDYVPDATRRRIVAMFDALPQPARGKKKVPFERRIAPEEHARLKSALVKAINTEIEKVEQEFAVTGNSFDKDELDNRLTDLYRAQYVLDGLKPTTPLPKTWHGLLTM